MAQQLIVLVVIPDELVRRAITDVLEDSTTHLVRSCADVATATAALKRIAPDLLVIDARLAEARPGQTLLLNACHGRPGLPVLRLIDGIPESVATDPAGTFDRDTFLVCVDELLNMTGSEGPTTHPLVRAPAVGHRASAPEKPITVLVIDDDTMIRDLLVTLVSGPERRVITASDGPAGLAAIREATPDLVILDQMMPRMAGMQVLEQLRSEGNPVPVVILSAHRTEGLTSRGWAAGMSLFLDKPFDIHTLTRWVERLLRNRTDSTRAS